jgi:hypothetical protein
MSYEHTFTGAQNAFTFLFGYINSVAQEIGMERATALITQMEEAMGAAHGKMLRQQAGLDEYDAIAAYSLGKGLIAGLGIDVEPTEQSPQRVVFKIPKCPVYEAAKMLGMDDNAIEATCRVGAIRYMDAVAKQLNPKLSHRLVAFRSESDGGCEEVIALA